MGELYLAGSLFLGCGEVQIAVWALKNAGVSL